MAKEKKKNTKEIEAERVEEERKQREEVKKDQEEKYGIKEMIEGKDYPMLLTEYYIKTAWDHNSPREFTKDYLFEQFKILKIIRLITDDELELFSNSILYGLIFAKDQLKLSDQNITLVVNLLFSLMINGDSRFNLEYPFQRKTEEEENEEEPAETKKKEKEKTKDKKKGKEPIVEDAEDGEHLEEESEEEFDRAEIEVGKNLVEKTYEGDMAMFKDRLNELVSSNSEVLTKIQIAKLVKHSIENYFNNFKLFNFYQKNKQLEEEVFAQVTIDEPYVSGPLSTANFLGKILTEDEIEQEHQRKIQEMLDEDKKIENDRLEKVAEAKREYEEWMGLDDQTVNMIKEKLSQTRQYMLKRIEQKKKEYSEKLSGVQGKKKK